MSRGEELPPGTLEMLVLRAIASEPLHGYGIAQQIEQLSEEVLRVEKGSLYPALDRVLGYGWATAEWGQSPTGRRARFYTITESGRRALGEKRERFELVFGTIARLLEDG
jgi:transcriptional regulator